MDHDGNELHRVVATVYGRHSTHPAISPSWLATAAMHEISFERDLHKLGYIGCHLQFRQIARIFCRRYFDPTEAGSSAEEDLFPGTLQERYPRHQQHGIEPEYVLRTLMSAEDVRFNVARMRRAAKALNEHADALEAWDLNRDVA